MAKTFKTIFEEIKEDLIGTLTAQIRLQKLTAIEKGVPVAVRGAYFALLAGVAVLFLLFLLLTAGFALGLIFTEDGGEAYFAVKSITLGFLSLSGIHLIVLIVFFLLADKICTAIQTSVINKQLDALDEEERREAARTAVTDPTDETTLFTEDDTAVYTVDAATFTQEKQP